jgi:hypothetical protein
LRLAQRLKPRFQTNRSNSLKHGYTWIHMVQFHFNCSFLVKCFSDFGARCPLILDFWRPTFGFVLLVPKSGNAQPGSSHRQKPTGRPKALLMSLWGP